MFDIHFYMATHEINKNLEKAQLRDLFNKKRSKSPIVYNIETTNACNMHCKMCPRTTLMTRKIESIMPSLFDKLIDQLKPWSEQEWRAWESFVQKKYHIPQNEMSENHFFLYIIPRVIQLHGYGDPMLDKHMVEYIKKLSDNGFLSYFSCNPSNINVEQTALMFENGLNYIKYSIESVDDHTHKEIRGMASNFTKSYKNICKLLDIKRKNGFSTQIVITMLDLNHQMQQKEYQKLKDAFKGMDVYIYLKSEDQQWYRKDYHETKSIHWLEFCRHPWMSMSVKSNGEVAMCMEDYNNEIILGDAHTTSLYDIWNGDLYEKFREQHLDLASSIKCSEACDMKMAGHFISN